MENQGDTLRSQPPFAKVSAELPAQIVACCCHSTEDPYIADQIKIEDMMAFSQRIKASGIF